MCYSEAILLQNVLLEISMNRFYRTFSALVFAVCLLTGPAAMAADSASHRKAVEDLLNQLNMEQVVQTSIERMVDMQVRQNPQLSTSKDTLLTFFNDTIGWGKIKDELTTIWMETFTEAELKDLITFYRTPTGQKALQMMPTLMTKGSQIGQQKIQARLPELQKLLEAQAPAKDAKEEPVKGKAPVKPAK